MSDGSPAPDWRRRAFPPSADPGLFWDGGPHGDALAALRDAVDHGSRVALVTGDAGTGKSLLLNVLAGELAANGTVVGALPSSAVDDAAGFRTACAHAFRLDLADPVSRDALEIALVSLVAAARSRGARVVLLIDEAQALPRACHAEMAWLLDTFDGVTIILAGPEEMRAGLATTFASPGAGDIVVTCLRAWSDAEVAAYVGHAVTRAGGDGEAFGADTVRDVWACSNGMPRLVNAICREALRTSSTPDAAAIRRCADAVNGASEPPPPQPPPAVPFELSRLPSRRHRRLTPGRLALAAGGIGALTVSAVLVSPSPSAYVDREPRSHAAAVPASVATALTPLPPANAAPEAAALDPPAESPPPAGRDPSDDSAPVTAPSIVMPAAPPPSPTTSHVAVALPPPSRPVPSAGTPRRPAGDVTAGSDRELATGPSEPIIDWLLEEYARRGARRSD